MLKVVDTSSNNSNVRFDELMLNNNIRGAIIRCGYGSDEIQQDDRAFEDSCRECDTNGLLKGTYLYSYALSEENAHSEAAHVIRLIKGKKFPLGIFIDMEDADGYKERHGLSPYSNQELMTRICEIFAEDLSAAGYDNVGLYANIDYRKNVLYMDRLSSMLQWVAFWGQRKSPEDVPMACDVWQYESGNAEDAETGLDMNYYYREITEEPPTEKPPVEEPPTEEPPTEEPPTEEPAPVSSKVQINVEYQVKTAENGILPVVQNLEDYAGIPNMHITGFAVKVDRGFIRTRVHIRGDSWLPFVYEFDFNDFINGYAGDGRLIDAVQIFYNTPQDVVAQSGYQKAKYRVAPIGGDYYDWQYDVERTNGQDGYAGLFGRPIDRIQVVIE